MMRFIPLLLAWLFIPAWQAFAQDTISAGEILKIWEKSAIDHVSLRFETKFERIEAAPKESEDPFSDGGDPAAPEEDPFSEEGAPSLDAPKMLIQKGSFWRAKSLGMKYEMKSIEANASNLLHDKGVYIHQHGPLFSTTIHKAGESEIESLLQTEVLLIWLDPAASRHPAGVLRVLDDAKFPIDRSVKGKGRVRMIEGEHHLTLAEEFGWRVIEHSRYRGDDLKVQHLFEYETSSEKQPLLKRCKWIHYEPKTKEIENFTTMEISEVKLDKVGKKELELEIPAPGLVYDYTVEPKREYILRTDGSMMPLSSVEHQKLLDELEAKEKADRR